MAERSVTVDLDDGGKFVIIAEQIGPALVADKAIEAKFSTIVSTIERVSGQVLDSIKRVSPSRAVVELGFGLAVEQGELVTLFAKAKADAAIKITLEWTERSDPNTTESAR